VPPNDPVGYQLPIAPPALTPTATIVNTGSPWWTFVLVAAAAIACTVLVTSVLIHLRHARSLPLMPH
jgi:hypothetical protein